MWLVGWHLEDIPPWHGIALGKKCMFFADMKGMQRKRWPSVYCSVESMQHKKALSNKPVLLLVQTAPQGLPCTFSYP
jgi:hypothetical protein